MKEGTEKLTQHTRNRLKSGKKEQRKGKKRQKERKNKRTKENFK